MIPSCERSSKTSQFWRPKTRTGGVPFGRRERALFVRKKADQNRFARAIRTDDRGVFPLRDVS